jgi:hypothetical protein
MTPQSGQHTAELSSDLMARIYSGHHATPQYTWRQFGLAASENHDLILRRNVTLGEKICMYSYPPKCYFPFPILMVQLHPSQCGSTSIPCSKQTDS